MNMSPEEKKKEKIEFLFIKLKEKVDLAVREILLSSVSPKFRTLVQYPISTGGKRLRSSLAIICAKLLGGQLKDVIYPAAGLEILHNYTLIVDDIIDHSFKRRSKATLWAKYGTSITECIDIDFAASVFQTANHSPYPTEISEIFARTAKTIVEGEILDILFERKGREEESYIVKNRPKTITQKEYIEMVKKKTASLFQACCEIGGICAGANPKDIEALKDYGLNLGIAFQVKDDILDIFGEAKKFGKKIGGDIQERKGGNIVLLFARKELNNKETNKIGAIMRKSKITQKDIKETISLIKKTNALEEALKFGEKFVQKAKLALKPLPQNKWNEALQDLAGFVIERQK